MSVLAKAGALFLQPAPATVVRPPAVAPAPIGTAAVLAAARDLDAAAGGVAAQLRAAARSRTAVVCRPGPLPAPRPATPSATKVARRLAEREVPAVASGALCRVALPEEPAAAVRATWRLIGALNEPLVLALCGREAGFDGLLSELDHLFLATGPGTDGALAELALASLSGLGPPTQRVLVPGTLVARQRAALGLVRLDPHEAAAVRA